MKYKHDKNTRSGYITLSKEKITKTIPLSDKIICDLDENGMLCGIEFLGIEKSEIIKISKNIQKSEFSFT